MATEFKTSFDFPYFKIVVHSNDKKIFDIIGKQFSDISISPKDIKHCLSDLMINIFCNKTPYHKIPRSRYDCFHGFTLFYNRYTEYEHVNQGYENSRVCYDVGPRTLRTVIDFKGASITSYIATPPDFEKDLLFDLIFFQPLKCLLQIKGFYLFHASCVAKNKQGVLLTGKSGSGKSTLALTLLRCGFDYFADDEIVLYARDDGVKCFSFPARPKIKKKSLQLFPELRKFSVSPASKKEKILINTDQQFPMAKDIVVAPKILIFPKYTQSKTRIEPFVKQKALAQLAKEEFIHVRYSGPQVYQKHFFVLSHLLGQVACYKLFYKDKDLDKIPTLISGLLKDSQ